MSTTSPSLSNIGSDRAKAWLVSVINPILEALDDQEPWMRNSRWTWRPLTGDFDALGRVRVFVSPRYRPNLDDLVESSPEIAARMDSYDVALEGLRKALQACHQKLTASQAFVEECVRTQRRPDKLTPEQRGALARDLATLVINNVSARDSDLAGLYSGTWSDSAERLTQFARHQIEPEIREVEHWGRMLNAAGAELKQALDRMRRDIVQTYALPPVPVD
jgi:hypothetical protein